MNKKRGLRRQRTPFFAVPAWRASVDERFQAKRYIDEIVYFSYKKENYIREVVSYATLVRNQVLPQSAVSMLAQANAFPHMLLRLLQE